MTPRRGFTLIELLTVVGIIIILVGLVAFGLSKVIGTSKVAATKVTLANLQGMVSEFEVATKGLKRQPPQVWRNGSLTPPPPPNPQIDVWRDYDPTDGPASTTNLEPDPAPVERGSVDRESAASGTPPRYNLDLVANTQLVMGLLLQAPNNKKIIEQFPSSQLMEALPTGLGGAKLTVGPARANYGSSTSGNTPNPPIVLDAWGNPIIFVVGGGLGDHPAGPNGIWLGYKGSGDPQVAASYDTPNHVARSRDLRPFWASAGPDGDFRKGDDNLYSFEN